VGEGVPKSRLGERVWVYEAQLGRPFGTAAEYVVVPNDNAVHLPDGIDFETGATIGIPAMTAYACLFLDGPITGKTVLVAGGAGACGSYAVQLAKWAGATVISTVSSDAKAVVAHESGADTVLNYRKDNVVSRVLEITEGKGVDRVIEVAFGANMPVDSAVLSQGGIIAAYASDADQQPRLPFSELMTKCSTVHFILVYAMSRKLHKEAADEINRCLERRALRPHIALRLPLSETIAAHEAVERGDLIGKVLVSP
jgi:NADPH2:quinone reductase